MKKLYDFKNEHSKLKALLIGTAIIMALFLGISLVISAIAYSTDNPTSNVGLLSLISFLVAGGVSGFLNMKMSGGNDFRTPLFSSLFFVCVFFVISTISVIGIN